MKKALAILVTIIIGASFLIHHHEPTTTSTLGAGELLAQEESLYAEINPETKEVIRVIVISEENLNTGKWGNPSNFVRTSSKSTIRKNYAGKGYVYDQSRDAFIKPKTDKETIFNEETATWEVPKQILDTSTTTK